MRYKILELLKQTGDYVSEQLIVEKFSLTRKVIWENIAELKAEGYNILSVTNKGYLFCDTEDILNEYEIKNCVFVPVVDSTNNLAKQLANEDCCEWTVVTCNEQTGGKGRLGRQWLQAQKEGVYMSVVLRPELVPQQAPMLTLVTGISVCEAVNELTGLKAGIKWPNDIVLNEKKVCGILTEMSAEADKVNYVVVGIGVNVNQSSFPNEIKDKATSIYMESKKNYRRKALICCIINKLEKNYKIFCSNGFSDLRQCYLDKCININKYVCAKKNNQTIEGVAVDITCDGEIVIKTAENELINIASGEVSLRGENNKYI